jgi:Tol biopolymer transport system component
VTGQAAPRTLEQSSAPVTLVAWSPTSKSIAVINGSSLVVIPIHGRAQTVATGTITGASFSPNSRRLVYAQAASLLVNSPVDLYTVTLGGGQPVAVTHNGASQSPLWGPHGIIYARANGPTNGTTTTTQLWLIQPNGKGRRQLTDIPIAPPFTGFEPIALSANGEHLLANLTGPDSAEAWIVDLKGRHVAARDLSAAGSSTIGNSISHNGQWILLTNGYASVASGTFSGLSVQAVPWTGGSPTTLTADGAFASWNR